jgi:endonuclease YncB( thermonuclease family)
MIKETLVLAALALGQTPTVTDGDTVKLAGVRIRLTDYDSPELFSPKCPKELIQARAAKLELERLIASVKLEIVPCATSNYGRLCARGTIEDKPLAQHMIQAKLASPYVCRPGWCPTKVDWCEFPN